MRVITSIAEHVTLEAFHIGHDSEMVEWVQAIIDKREFLLGDWMVRVKPGHVVIINDYAFQQLFCECDTGVYVDD